jgi:circadian clock protein KaiC
MMEAVKSEVMSVRTGVAGLDDVLNGGLTPGHVYLIEGNPGTGKTTIALRFLLEGAKAGETGLYIVLSETEQELRNGAASHGWTIEESVEVFELAPADSLLDAEKQQSLLYSSDLELGEATRSIFAAFERVKPSRVVLDSLSEIRLLAQSSLRYRRQLLAIKHFFSGRGATVLLLDDLTAEALDKTAHSIVHAVIQLEEIAPTFGAERRRLRISKFRGRAVRRGYHDFTIRTGGAVVFPRLVASEHRSRFERTQLTTGVAQLDALLGGGIEQGSSTLILGPAGAGKSTFAIQFLVAAASRGEKAAMFVFDEELGLLFDRMRKLGVDLEAMGESGSLVIQQVDAAELSPGEFAHFVRAAVDSAQAKAVVIDSLNGYQQAMPEEGSLILHIHELLQYLNRQGANTFLTVAQHGIIGDMKAPFDITYLADTVILLRYFEALGAVRRAVSVIKKRIGGHETTIREYNLGAAGLTIGQPLTGFRGVLDGLPFLAGSFQGSSPADGRDGVP